MANPSVEEIFAATNVVDLVSEYVTLTKKGKNYIGLCPFHQEKTPSFTVSQDKKLAHCFSCGKGGNPAQFLMDLKRIEFREALEILAKKAGMEYKTSAQTEKSQSLAKYYEITAIAKEFYKRNLLKTESGQIALEYLHKRGISDETIKMFDIGLAPSRIDSLYQALKEANFLDLDMKTVGLIKTGATGNYDMFVKRIMFPITNEKSEIVGFSARLYGTDNTQPKYINSTENIIFKKSEVLYNLDKASLYITKVKRVVLHEGFMDVFASVTSGIQEAVCSMGTALTDSHARLLKKYTENVVICYDGDKAGLAAAKKAITVFKRNQMNIHVVILPEGKDPDEYVRAYGKTAYVDYFNNNQIDAVEFLYQYALMLCNKSDFSQVAVLKQDVFTMLRDTGSQTTVETYLGRLAVELKVSSDSIFLDYTSYCNTQVSQKYVEYLPEDKKNSNISTIPVDAFEDEKSVKRKLVEFAYLSKEYCRFLDTMFSQYDLLDHLGREFGSLWYQICDGYYNRYDIFSTAKFEEYLAGDPEVYLIYKDYRTDISKEDLSEKGLREILDTEIRNAYIFKIKELYETYMQTKVTTYLNDLTIKRREYDSFCKEHTSFINTKTIRK